MNKLSIAVASVAIMAGTAVFAQGNATPAVPHFVEQAIAAGIEHQYRGPWEYFVGGGVASFDCNNDHLADVFVAGGEVGAKLYVNQSGVGDDLSFRQQQLPEPDMKKVIGAYPVNLDNDGFVDLAVLRLGENYLLKGGPDCAFTQANNFFGFDGGNAWTTGFSALWEDGAIYPTLVFGNYIDRDAVESPWGTCEDNLLVRASGERPKYSNVIELSPGFCSLSVLATDWNGTGQTDIRLSNDRQYYRGGREQLWSLNSGGKPFEYTESDGWRELVIWGMGVAQADLDGDGRPEYALTSMGDTKLQTLDHAAGENRPDYRDTAFEKGATAQRPYQGDNSKPSTGWHAQFADFNNDGNLDLFIAKGNVERMPEFAAIDPDNLLLGLDDGNFSEQGGAAGLALARRGRGAVVEDFNLDGLLDMLVVNREEPVSLFRNLGTDVSENRTGAQNFLSINLANGPVNPNAVGAVVEIETAAGVQTRIVHIGGGHASGQLGLVHFGIGDADEARLRVKWPGAGWSKFYTVAANSFVNVKNGAENAEYLPIGQ